MTQDECKEYYLKTGTWVFETYDADSELIIAEITWENGDPGFNYFRNYLGNNNMLPKRQPIPDPNIDSWCEF